MIVTLAVLLLFAVGCVSHNPQDGAQGSDANQQAFTNVLSDASPSPEPLIRELPETNVDSGQTSGSENLMTPSDNLLTPAPDPLQNSQIDVNQTSQDAAHDTTAEQAHQDASSGFDTPSSAAPAGQLPGNMGVVTPDAASGGMPPASDAGQAPGSPISQSPSTGSEAEPATPQEPETAAQTATQYDLQNSTASQSEPSPQPGPTPQPAASPDDSSPNLQPPPQPGPTPSPSDFDAHQSQTTSGSPPPDSGTQPQENPPSQVNVPASPKPTPQAGPPPQPVTPPALIHTNGPTSIAQGGAGGVNPGENRPLTVTNNASSEPNENIENKPIKNDFDTSVNSVDDVDRILKTMHWGQMAFDVPVSMPVNSSVIINLLISPTESTNQLVAAVTAEIVPAKQQTNRVEASALKISGQMQAVLTAGSAFNIQRISPEIQMLSKSEPTEWKWQIDSMLSGSQELHLTVNAVFRFNGEDRYQMIRTFDRAIQVTVIPAPALARYWPLESILGLFVAAGVSRVARGRIMEKRRKNAELLKGMSKKGADVFISYSRRDQERILPLVGKLKEAGFKVWIDQGGIDGAALWAREITDAIRNAKVVVLAASPASFASDHVVREISMASEEHKPILPVFLEPVEIPPTIRYPLTGIQRIELYGGDKNEKIAQVIRSLEKLGITADKSQMSGQTPASSVH